MKTTLSTVILVLTCGHAVAQPVWTYEARSIYGNVYAPFNTNGDSRSSMSNLLRFEAGVSPNASGECTFDGMEIGTAFANVDTMQDSYLSATGAFARGRASAYVGETPPWVPCGASCDTSSGGVVEFTILAETSFLLTFDLFSETASASINLYHRTSGTYVVMVAAQTEGSVTGVRSGVLPPGRYMLDWDASAAATTTGTLGETASYDFSLLIGGGVPCIADFNQDGGVDGGDVEAFFLAWEAGETSADVNEDGGVDGGDVETFFTLWEAGGCG